MDIGKKFRIETEDRQHSVGRPPTSLQPWIRGGCKPLPEKTTGGTAMMMMMLNKNKTVQRVDRKPSTVDEFQLKKWLVQQYFSRDITTRSTRILTEETEEQLLQVTLGCLYSVHRTPSTLIMEN